MNAPVQWPRTTELLYRRADGTVVEEVEADEFAHELNAIEQAYREAYDRAIREAEEEHEAHGEADWGAEEEAREEFPEEARRSSPEEASEEVEEGAAEGAAGGVVEEVEEVPAEEPEGHAIIAQPQEDDSPQVATGVHQVLRAGKCPVDIGLWRQMLFSLETPIEMTVSQFEMVWPYVTNCWTFNSNSYKYGDHFLYRCVFGAKRRPTTGKGIRAKPIRAVSGCPAYMKMVPKYAGEDRTVVGYTLFRPGSAHNDDHSLETADKARLNSALVDMVAFQLWESYWHCTGHHAPKARQSCRAAFHQRWRYKAGLSSCCQHFEDLQALNTH